MEFRRIRYLEEDIFHDVGTKWHLELEWLSLEPLAISTSLIVVKDGYFEQNVIETPRLGSKHRRETNLTLLHEKCEIDSARARISSCPGLAGSSVGCMTIGAEGLAINPSLRNCIDSLSMAQPADKNCQNTPIKTYGKTDRSLETTAVLATLTRTT